MCWINNAENGPRIVFVCLTISVLVVLVFFSFFFFCAVPFFSSLLFVGDKWDKMDAVYSAFNSQLVNENKQFEREMKSWARASGSLVRARSHIYTTSTQWASSSSSSQPAHTTHIIPWRLRDRLRAESYKITVVVVFSNKCQRKSHFMCSIHNTLQELVSDMCFFFSSFVRFFFSFLFPIYMFFFIISLSASSFCLLASVL